MPVSLRRPFCTPTVCAAVMLAIPDGASAITVRFNQLCYAHVPTRGSQPIVIALSGGTPSASLLLSATVDAFESAGAAPASVSGTPLAGRRPLTPGAEQPARILRDVAPPALAERVAAVASGRRVAMWSAST